MRRWTLLLLSFALIGNADAPRKIALPPICGVTLNDPVIAPILPADVQAKLPSNFNVVQRAMDVFSWQEFIALNWPADPRQRGKADPSKPLGSPGLTVWETWKEEYEVYRPDGAPPAPWNEWVALPEGCPGRKILFRDQKIDDFLDASVQAAAADGTLPATLTDQRGGVVRYEIRMNEVMFDYIVQNRLYDGRVQQGVTRVDWPDGAIILKAAWRPVAETDAPRYLTREACVCEGESKEEKKHCVNMRMGLVGLHVIQKTPSAPQFIWSTYEQVDNLRGTRPSFNDPACTNCPANKQSVPGIPNQVTRVTPIPKVADCSQPKVALDDLVTVNQRVRNALPSPVSFYEVVGTQWPQPPVDRVTPTVFRAQPPVLANTTMETFVQRTSTCLGCHSMARTINLGTFVSAEFTFTLNNAQPTFPNPDIFPFPAAPRNAREQKLWPALMRAQAIANNTYEMFPPPRIKSKLHCSSCHLDAGRTRTAAWWVGTTYRFPGDTLIARINQCFLNSMNGEEICTGDACDTNVNMQSLITYMQFLTDEWDALHPKEPAPCGFRR